MGKTVRQAARATVRLVLAAAMTFGLYLFVTVLLITAITTLAVVGAWMLPETVLLIRRIAGAKRQQVAAWTGREIPEAYQPLTVRERVRAAVRDPGTLTDLYDRHLPLRPPDPAGAPPVAARPADRRDGRRAQSLDVAPERRVRRTEGAGLTVAAYAGGGRGSVRHALNCPWRRGRSREAEHTGGRSQGTTRARCPGVRGHLVCAHRGRP
ncbi:sensor domain-containing protein [Streptomyces yaanensis]|uniref:Sensor domain-containing protein n=1 Tax=Streptomyces yaanensis TaxID=1142239 RepID=A0ABV7SBA6_9ACTN|nr:sensor domain-containing protein [Streptomyces sp. CGMCC 4.7035]WNB96682.1 sensor domain-containing protein [Streptomyces sp. CGMCC 4.7035]